MNEQQARQLLSLMTEHRDLVQAMLESFLLQKRTMDSGGDLLPHISASRDLQQKIALVNASIAPLREMWNQDHEEVPDQLQSEIRDITTDSRHILEKSMEAMDNLKNSVRSKQEDVGEDLDRLVRSKRLRDAYGKQPKSSGGGS